LSEDDGHRRASCSKCKETLDPFEVLWRYARTDDKLRQQAKAWAGLREAWAWIWENKGALTISRRGVRVSIEINGKRRSRKGNTCQRDGLASLIIGAVDSLKMMKKWEPGGGE